MFRDVNKLPMMKKVSRKIMILIQANFTAHALSLLHMIPFPCGIKTYIYGKKMSMSIYKIHI